MFPNQPGYERGTPSTGFYTTLRRSSIRFWRASPACSGAISAGPPDPVSANVGIECWVMDGMGMGLQAVNWELTKNSPDCEGVNRH